MDEDVLRTIALRTVAAVTALQRRADDQRETAQRALERHAASQARDLALFHATLESSPDGLIAYDRMGQIIAHNRRFLALWGLPPRLGDGWTATRIASVIAPQVEQDASIFDRAREVRTDPQRITTDEIRLKDGRTVERSTRPLESLDTCIGVVVSWRDITERRQSEAMQAALLEQLRDAQRLESIGALAGGIAHDFNNILGAILGNVMLARAARDQPAEAAAHIDDIEELAKRATLLVRRILSFSRRQRPAESPIPIVEMMEECVRLLRATLPARVELITDIPTGLPPLRGDATQLQQVVVNLCTNAAHALTERGPDAGPGRIRVTVHSVDLPDGVAPLTLPEGRYTCLQVEDNGVGMDESTSRRVFDPFFTTRAVGEGTGLGLPVALGIATDHGGTITVTSQHGAGTVVRVYLPQVLSLEPGAPPEAPASTAPASGTAHVVVVDDEHSMTSVLRRLLERAHYRVSTFHRADDAMAWMARQDQPPDLVISDYNMPEQSGLDLAQAALRLTPDLPIVLVSGFVTSELEAQALQVGVREVLHKPDLPIRLLEVVSHYTRNATQTG